LVIVYRLGVAPGDADGEGEDHDQWFGTLKEAKERREELIDRDPFMVNHKYGVDYRIVRYVVGSLRGKNRVLALLRRQGWCASYEEVVPAYKAPEWFSRASMWDCDENPGHEFTTHLSGRPKPVAKHCKHCGVLYETWEEQLE
jgi:hypothetical protein